MTQPVNIYFILEIIGTVAFAISGAMVASEKKMDILGVVILGMTTAVGGGVIRDIIIGVTPPNAFRNPLYALIAIVVSLIVFIPSVRGYIDVNSVILVTVDAIGLGVFTVIGVKTSARFDNFFLEIFLGTLTGVGGGVLRDIFAMEKPMIFVRHFYAVASISGALVCSLLFNVNETVAMISGITVIVVLRCLAARFKWHLPKA